MSMLGWGDERVLTKRRKPAKAETIRFEADLFLPGISIRAEAMDRKSMAITDFLTAEQIAKARALWKNRKNGSFHHAVMTEIVEPNMEEINRKLGQDNVPGFIAYAIEYVMMQEDRFK
jgi:hypothetical protein